MNSTLKTISYVAAILALSIAVAALFVITEPKPEKVSRKLAPTAVDVFRIRRRNLSPEANLTGRLQPGNKALLRFEVSGRIDQRVVEPGVRVTKGQVLLILKDGDFKDALTDAKAQHTLETEGIQRDQRLLELAKNNTRLQKREVNRLIKLRKNSLISQTRLGEARQRLFKLRSEEARLTYSVNTAKARLNMRKSALERAGRNLARTRLTAPFAGVINTVTVQKGDSVTPAKVVVELVSVDSVELLLYVRNQVAAALTLHDLVKVKIRNREVVGKIIALQADPDSTTFTHAVRISLPTGSGIPGMLARVSLRLSPLRGVLVVPSSAVLREHGSAYVMVIDENNRVNRRNVVLGRRVSNWHVVLGGLSLGEVIVLKDISSLRDGQMVRRREFKSRVDISKH